MGAAWGSGPCPTHSHRKRAAKQRSHTHTWMQRLCFWNLALKCFGFYFHPVFLASSLFGKHRNKRQARRINPPEGINLETWSPRMMAVNENGNFWRPICHRCPVKAQWCCFNGAARWPYVIYFRDIYWLLRHSQETSKTRLICMWRSKQPSGNSPAAFRGAIKLIGRHFSPVGA